MDKKAETGRSAVAERLREFRKEAAEHGVTMTALAKALGKKGASSYQHWEDRFKGDVLPLKVAKALAPVFEGKGISAAPLFEMAGVINVVHRSVNGSDTSKGQPGGELQEMLMPTSREEADLIKTFRSLDSRRRVLLLNMAEDLEVAQRAADPFALRQSGS